jgi:hypothetical protein
MTEEGASPMQVSKEATRVRATARWYRRSISVTDGTLVTIILSFWAAEILWKVGKHLLAHLP